MMIFPKTFFILSKPVTRYGILPVTSISPLNQSSGPTPISTSPICMPGRSFQSRTKREQSKRNRGDSGLDLDRVSGLSDRDLGRGSGRGFDPGSGPGFDLDFGGGFDGDFDRVLGLFLPPFNNLIVHRTTHIARIINTGSPEGTYIRMTLSKPGSKNKSPSEIIDGLYL